MAEIKEIVTHRRPHLDEAAAIWLLRRFGEPMFPGVSQANIELRDAGAQTPDGRSAEEWEQDGVLFIGIGGGRFDEHPSAENGRKEGECAASLVACALEMDNDPALERILEFITLGDTQGTGGPYDLKALVDTINAFKPEDPTPAVRFVMTALDALYAKNKRWHESKREYNKVSKLVAARPYRVVLITSDNEEMRTIAFSRGAQVVIVRRSSGHTQIFSHENKGGPELNRVAAELRRQELLARGEEQQLFTVREQEGSLADWYFQQAGQFILNGSLTAPGVPSTLLSVEQIIAITQERILNP